jgi:hypothetical protein
MGIPGLEYRPSLRRYYPDQVQRVAVYSALNRRSRARLPGDGAMIGAMVAAVYAVRRRSARHAISSAALTPMAV